MNRYFVEFALSSLRIEKIKNIFIGMMLSLLVFLLGSVLFISSSIRYELTSAASELPEIIVQKKIAAKQVPFKIDAIYPLLNIAGVSTVVPRVWGMYRFDQTGEYFSVIGIDRYDYKYIKALDSIANIFLKKDSKDATMIVGQGVYTRLKERYYTKYFNFITPDGDLFKVNIAGVFQNDLELFSNDVIVTDLQTAQKILGIQKGYVSDIAIKIPNKDEIPTIAKKISLLNPNFNVITKEETKARYKEIFDYKKGVFLVLFLIVLFTFFFIVTDRLTGISQNQKREIAVLKALGWSILDVIRYKFIESFFIASFAYMAGITIALVYVYIFQAPFLRDIFTGFDGLKPSFDLIYHVDIFVYVILFLMSVAVYMAAVIIPAWKIAVVDVDEVLR